MGDEELCPKILIVENLYRRSLEKLDFDGTPPESLEHLEHEVWKNGVGFGSTVSHHLRQLGWRPSLCIANSVAWGLSALALPRSWVLDSLIYSLLAPFRMVRRPNLLGPAPTFMAILAILRNRPDIVLVLDKNLLSRLFFFVLRSLQIKCVLYCGVDLPAVSVLRQLDGLVSPLQKNVASARQAGVFSELLFHAFDSERFTLADQAKSIDVIFIGSISPKHPTTVPALQILHRAGIDVHIYTPNRSELSQAGDIEDCFKGEVWGVEMHEKLRQSKIVINRHIVDAGEETANLRMFEAAGQACVVMTETSSNLSSLFVPGEEVIGYESYRELPQIVANLLAQPEQLQKIGARARERVMKSHLFSQRARILSDFLKAVIEGGEEH